MLPKILKDVLGLKEEFAASRNLEVPLCLSELYETNRRLSTSILHTELNILPYEQYYENSGFTVFAEEAQRVVMWGFKECNNDATCYQIVNNEPIEVYEEDDKLEAVVIGMVVTNLLSCDLMNYWFDCKLSPKQFSGFAKCGLLRCGVLSNVQTYVYKSVICNLEVDHQIRLDAASQSEADLEEFKALVAGVC